MKMKATSSNVRADNGGMGTLLLLGILFFQINSYSKIIINILFKIKKNVQF